MQHRLTLGYYALQRTTTSQRTAKMTVDFNDYFWGEKNNGYEVLYQNMKYGLSATKELAEYFRERSNLEEYNSKLLTKLANKAGSSGGGTFSPLWIILKSTTERLSELHAQKVQKLTELVKNVTKYAEDLHKKHKSVKEDESGTQDAVQAMKESTTAVAKAKDVHNARLQEVEKARKDNSTKEIEKSEAKLRKHQDDYKALVEKHNIIKQEFEKKMTITCRRFQEMEEAHLKQMKEFLSSYMDIVQNNFDLVGQVHSDLKRQFLELTVDKLLEQFVLNKYTGLEKPELIELDFESGTGAVSSGAGGTNSQQLLVNTAGTVPLAGSISPAPSSLAGGLLESPTLSATSSSQPTAIGTTTTKKESHLPGGGVRRILTGSEAGRSSVSSAGGATVSAPTSPNDPESGSGGGGEGAAGAGTIEQQIQQQPGNSFIGRNPLLRGSKFSGFLRSRREKAKSKKAKKKKDSAENSSAKEDNILDGDSKGEAANADSATNLQTTSAVSSSNVAPTATPEVDEDGYSIQPRENTWDSATITEKSNNFYSSSDSDSEDEREEKKIHVEIKPLNNGAAPISASVDELRATVENLSLSPIGILTSRQIPTPTSAGGSSIAIPRPPSRRSEAAVARDRVSPASQIARADSVGSLEFRSPSVGIGSSRGPSPLTIGMSDTIPLAVAFHEIIHAYFKGADESRCQVKMSGDMMISFPAGIVNVLTNNPNPAKLGFRIKNLQNLDNMLPNKQLVTIDRLQSTSFSTTLEFNMPVLTATLRRQSEQNPNAPHINVDILKYQIKAKPGAASCPFQLVSYWKCEQRHTDIKIDYKYNCHAMAQPSPLLNVSISVPVDGGVKNVQSKPHSAWQGELNRLVWNFTDISQHSDSGGVDTLRARLEVGSGPSTPAIIATQFNCEGTTLSGIEFELAGSGYRLSLVKRRFVSGKYICEGDGIRTVKTPTPPNVSGVMSPVPFGSSNSKPAGNNSAGSTTG
uniref:MHD domain-containing protein n=1 Tax=Anopheles farauti TaxID=69004 RepID=A0A182Q8I3_9DIPT